MTGTMDGDTRRVHAPPGGLVMDLGGLCFSIAKIYPEILHMSARI